MGHTLSIALGVALGNPQKRVICLSITSPLCAGRLLIVTSAGFTKRGITAKLQAEADKRRLSKQIQVFDKVTANPELDFLDQIAREMRGRGIGGIIAVGGGTVLDTAKILSVTIPGLAPNLREVLQEGRDYQWQSRLPVVAMPGTAGTGAEVTPLVTVWDKKNGKKYSVSGEMLYPVHALIDPELTLTLPLKETRYSGLDAVSHALESLWNKNSNAITETFAFKYLVLANEALPALLKRPESVYLRTMMQQAALFSGFAISQTRTAIAHAVSYSVTIRFGVPHGLACSFILPGLIKHYTASLDNGQIKTVMHKTLKNLESLNLNDDMANYTRGVDLSKYIDEMFHADRTANYAGTITKEDIIGLLE